MAYPIELTIGTGNKVTVNYQSKDVSVSLTYRLERGDEDVLAVAREKSGEVVAVHNAAWERVRANVQSQSLSQSHLSQSKEVKSGSIPIEKDSEESGIASVGEKSGPHQKEPEASNANAESNRIAVTDDVITHDVSTNNVVKGAAGRRESPVTSSMLSTAGQHLALRALLAQSGLDGQGIEDELVTRFECDSLEELSYEQASGWLLELQRSERERVRSHRVNFRSTNSTA